MALKYKFNLKDISVQDFKVYFLGMFKSILPKKKIKNLSDLESFIQKKSAWISQVTLYSYLKTRMGTRYVLHFDNEKLLAAINKAKWNIYSIALQDLTFFSFSYLNAIYNYEDIIKSKDIFHSILDNEKKNGMPEEVYDSAKISFDERFQKVDWKKHYNSLPFNDSALALYKWAPIADAVSYTHLTLPTKRIV